MEATRSHGRHSRKRSWGCRGSRHGTRTDCVVANTKEKGLSGLQTAPDEGITVCGFVPSALLHTEPLLNCTIECI